MKKTLPLLFLTILLSFCTDEKKLLRKASNAVDQSDFDKAIGYYDQIIQKNDKSFFGNAGKGIVLSEFQGRHEQAIPYLEKALQNSPDKSKPIINADLGKSYHFIGNYKRALLYYGKLDNNPKYNDYDEFLSKRIADCKYAIEHPSIATAENQDVKNIGSVVNTDKPEYTPVYSNGTMYFTSKRQDDPKEKKNGIDGKYFESIYTTKLQGGSWTTPQKFDLPKGFHMRKFGEAVASISPDGQKLFIYKAGKIYETDVNNTDHMKQLDKQVNFSALQNHAALSPDGKTMYFTSESSKGNGGSDIYFTTRNDDGSWADPQALDYINTQYDEEAPFITADGVLYFASNGHPGYGGFDIYKTWKVNGSWTKPENLGQPINSSGDDIFFSLMNNSSNGYYASARPGGFGDLDIYHVHYLRTENVECKPTDLLTINATPDQNDPMRYNVELQTPDNFKANVRSYRWTVDGKDLPHTGESFQHTFTQAGDYKIGTRVVSYCDTCPTLNAWCAEKNLTIGTPVLASNEPNDTYNKDKNAGNLKGNKKGKVNAAGNEADENGNAKNSKPEGNGIAKNSGSGKNKKGTTQADKTGGAIAANSKGGNKEGQHADNNASDETDAADNSAYGSNSNANYKHLTNNFVSDDKLKEMKWNTSMIYFDYDDASLRGDAKTILDQNINVLKDRQSLSVVISGYADSRGSDDYNKRLSARRARSVKNYLVSNGVAGSQIRGTKGLGETQLVNSCTDGTPCDDNQHQQNRRVKMDVVDSKSAGTITLK
jgi:outer membrane protein OmpA-like peptidoglycan-associated protein/tetratricopeptide (TPR) repeat protein